MNLKAPAESDAVLRVFVGGAAQPAVEKPVRLSPEGAAAWVALHGHCCPTARCTCGWSSPIPPERRSRAAT